MDSRRCRDHGLLRAIAPLPVMDTRRPPPHLVEQVGGVSTLGEARQLRHYLFQLQHQPTQRGSVRR